MTDYWVSKEKHYCKYCNAWIQGDQVSIKRHEQGNRHKMIVQDTFRQKRQAKTKEEHAQRELQKQLLEIENAAQERFAQDLAGVTAKTGVVPPPPPPRPPHRSFAGANQRRQAGAFDNASRHDGQHHQQMQVDQQREENEEKEDEEDTTGIYMVRGRVFLEGKRHEDKLLTGTACEIWVEEVEEWLDAVIDGVKEQPIPNTELVLRTFTLSYVLPQAHADDEAVEATQSVEPTRESNVRSDRLRIKLPEGTTLANAEQVALGVELSALESEPHEQIVIDEDTGMGEWSTVSVREIDDSEEAQEARRKEAEQAAHEEKEAQQAQAKAAQLEEPEMASEDAFAAYNPFGGTYKGIQIGLPTHQRHEEIHLVTTRGNVEFKKKKKPTKRLVEALDGESNRSEVEGIDTAGFRASKKKKNKRTTMSE